MAPTTFTPGAISMFTSTDSSAATSIDFDASFDCISSTNLCTSSIGTSLNGAGGIAPERRTSASQSSVAPGEGLIDV